MAASALVRTRIIYSEGSFAEVVLWQLARPVPGSTHGYKCRLAYVVNRECVVRFDNEAGKGDHRHYGRTEERYSFSTPERLVSDFQRDIARWDRENRHTRS